MEDKIEELAVRLMEGIPRLMGFIRSKIGSTAGQICL